MHELNNTSGHEAGDEMIRYIGRTITQLFGNANAYRIGGDEFVIFCLGSTKEAVADKIRRMEEILHEKRYKVSIGEAWNDDKIGLKKQIAIAERQMYTAKQKYYEDLGEPGKIRNYRDYLDSLSAIC